MAGALAGSIGLGRRRRRVRRVRRVGGGVGDRLRSINAYLRKHRVVSKSLAFGSQFHPELKKYATIAKTLGYGRRKRRTRRRRVGGGLLSDVHKYVKKHRLISRGLSFGSQFHKPLGKYAGIARKLGYGRRMMGGSMFSVPLVSTQQIAVPRF